MRIAYKNAREWSDNMIDYRKLTAAMIAGVITIFTMTGCSMPWQKSSTGNTSDIQGGTVENPVETGDSSTSLEFDAEDLDASYNESNCTKITLSGNSASVNGNGATAENAAVTITSSGTYLLSGTLSEGSIKVSSSDNGTVRLIFDGVDISNSSQAPVVVETAKKVIITLADGTTNTVTDSARQSAEDEDYSGAISSKEDMVINGTGTLIVNAGYRNGIKSSDDLEIVSGNFKVTSAEDGIIGKDLLEIMDGDFTIDAGCDGMKSTYDTDTSKGNVIITGGNFNIKSENDGIQSENILSITGGTFNIVTGEGAAASVSKSNESGMTGGSRFGGDFNFGNSSSDTDTESIKGIKAVNAIYITEGTYILDCEDDGIHSNGTVLISGGNLTISSGDDGIHADEVVQLDGGTVDINTSYEGIEGTQITINGGDISVMASDDGLNASNGDSTGSAAPGGMGAGANSASGSSGSSIMLNINGGNLFVNAGGDGLDSNGSASVSSGNVIVLGPTDSGNTALDFENEFTFSGGTLMAFGSSGMLETPTGTSNGCCIVAAFTSQSAGTEFSLKDSSGNTVLSYTPSKSYSAAIVYSEEIKSGSVYTLSAGSVSQSITANEGVTTSGVSGGMGGFNGGGAAGGNGGNAGAVPGGRR